MGMPDRESVMQALKDSLRNQYCGFIENVGNVYAVSEETINDTLELLKEKESVIEALKSDLDETLAVLGEHAEIVRCRDCKYWRQLYGDEPGRCVCDDMWGSLDGEAAEVEDIRTDSDFYCGYAVRR